MNREDQLNQLSETAVNGRIVHKIDLIGMVKICGVHYFNVYRRYNNVYEIVIEDSNGDFYLQRDNRLRYSIGKVLCLSEEQMNSMYTTELYSFRHGGTPPTSSPAPENMTWSDIHREWYGMEINLRGVFEEYHAFMSQFYSSSEDSDSDSDMDRSETSEDVDDNTTEDEDEKEYFDEKSDSSSDNDQEESDEDPYADMPELISDSDSDSEPETPPRNTVVQPPQAPLRSQPQEPFQGHPVEIHIHHSTPICCRNLASAWAEVTKGKRTFEQYSESDQEESEEDVSVKEESSEEEEEEEARRGSGPDEYIILRNGTKYRKIN